MSSPKPNIHGRRWGRGPRPWLIMAKALGASAFLGGLASVFVILRTAPKASSSWPVFVELIERAFTSLVIPGSTIAVAAGVLLLASAWRVLLRMRWLQLKLAVVVLGLPALHLFLRSELARLSRIVETEPVDAAIAGAIGSRMTMGVGAGFALGVLAVCLGRIKPRLGQRYGRTFARRPPEADETA